MIDLKKVVSTIKTKYGGKDSTIRLGRDEPDTCDYISTGNLAFDLSSEGGIPWGYLIELLGFSQSGKSLFIHTVIANAQRDYNAIGVLVDRENAYTKPRGAQLGINNDNLLIIKPQDIPRPLDAFNFILDSVRAIRKQDAILKEKNKEHKDTYIIVGIDSISAFGKDVALEKSDSGRKAKSIHEGLRETLTVINEKVSLVVANQVTFKIGVLFGDPRTSTAGESMKYYSTVRFGLDEKALIIDPSKNNEVIGSWIEVEVIKTRLGPSYRKCYIPHFYKEGVPYHGGYARLLYNRGYLEPNNKKEFNSFKQKTLKFNKETDEDEEQVNEFNIEPFLEKHPEMLFDTYPEFKKEEKNDNKETKGSSSGPVSTESDTDSKINSDSEI